MNIYAESKREFTNMSNKFNLRGSIKLVDLYLHHIYGLDESINKFSGWLLNELKKKNNNIKLSLGDQLRDFIYIKDVISAI